MVTTVAGPLVNVLLCMFCTIVLVAWTGRLGAVPWNPLHPMWPVDLSFIPTTVQLRVIRLFGLSYFILLINLLPIFPFDGGRIVQAWLWPRKGYQRSMEIATGTGMVGAILVGLCGLFMEQSWLLLMIAVFGYMTCWQNRRMLREQGEIDGGEFGYDFSQGYTSLNPEELRPRKPGFLERRRARRQARKA
jgi:Zn-dependent protease